MQANALENKEQLMRNAAIVRNKEIENIQPIRRGARVMAHSVAVECAAMILSRGARVLQN